MKPPYFITGLPRSRTAWLANFLTWGDSFCYHEATFGCENIEDLRRTLETVPHNVRDVGDADPNIGLIHDDILKAFPDCRVVFILRDLEDCVQGEWHAMVEDGSPVQGATEGQLRNLMRKATNGLSHLFTSLPTHSRLLVRYDSLDTESKVRSIWTFCLPETPFPQQRYEMLRDLRVTQIMGNVLRRNPTQPFLKWLENDAPILENRTAVHCGA